MDIGELQGAVVTVTGHDHLSRCNRFTGCGRIQSIVQLLRDGRRPRAQRSLGDRCRLARNWWPVDCRWGATRSVVLTAVLGAARFGLVMERVMAMLGVHDHAQRARPSGRVAERGGSGNEEIRGTMLSAWASPADGSKRSSRFAPRHLLAGSGRRRGHRLRNPHSMRGCLETMTSVTGPSDQVIAGGGWAQLDGVLRAKGGLLAACLAAPSVAGRSKGAAAFAGIAAGMTDEEELTRARTCEPCPTTWTAPTTRKTKGDRFVKTLADIADDNGTFAIIAMDQRSTLRRMFDAVGEEATPSEVMAQAKVDVAANPLARCDRVAAGSRFRCSAVREIRPVGGDLWVAGGRRAIRSRELQRRTARSSHREE